MEYVPRKVYDDLFDSWDTLSRQTRRLKAEENWFHDVDKSDAIPVRLVKVRLKNEEYHASSLKEQEAWDRLKAVRPDPYELLSISQDSSATEIEEKFQAVLNSLYADDRAACQKMNNTEDSSTDAEKAVRWTAAANRVTFYEMLEEFLQEVKDELISKAPPPKRRKILGLF